jgi:membrane protease YdiL (CAAX protease family)
MPQPHPRKESGLETMSPSYVDHALFAVIALFYPLYWKRSWERRERSGMASGGGDVRLATYRKGITGEWLMVAIVAACWLLLERGAEDIGLGAPAGWPFWVGFLLCAAYAVFGVRQVAELRRSADARRKTREQLAGDVGLLIPRTDREMRMFTVLGISAGVCEEIAYRGFLLWYLGNWLAWPLAVVAGAAVFGFAHLYLGWTHVLRTGLVGLVLGALYVFTGSLWVPILLHAVVDIVSGHAGRVTLEESVTPA